MDMSKIIEDLPVPTDDESCKHLTNFIIPSIKLPNQDGNLLKLNRLDTFRVVLYCYSMTGRPDRALPDDWDLIPGAKGCTIQNCTFRDNYDQTVSLNAVPVGVSTQPVDDLKEMDVDNLAKVSGFTPKTAKNLLQNLKAN